MNKLIDHLHAFARETRLTTEEWRVGLEFITECGRMCNDDRQELDVLSGVLGLNVLVDSLNNPKLASPGKGEVCLVLAIVKDTQVMPIEGVKIDVWETDHTCHYDRQYNGRDKSDMHEDSTEKLLRMLNRHFYRPAYIHFRIRDLNNKYNELITALYIHGDPYESRDAVLDVKTSLIVDALKVEDASIAKKYDVCEQDWLIKYDFVLTTWDETQALLTTPTHVQQLSNIDVTSFFQCNCSKEMNLFFPYC